MKKKITSVVIALLMITFIHIQAFSTTDLPYVNDAAGLLTSEQAYELEENSTAIADEYGIGVYMITVDSIKDYTDTENIESAAEEMYAEYGLGKGEGHNGVLLILSMAEREWALYAYGHGNTVFNGDGRDHLSGSFLDDFKRDDWYKGFEDYQRICGELIAGAESGSPISTEDIPGSPYARIYGVAACIILGFTAAFIVRWILKRQLRSVAEKTDAEAFISSGGLHLNEHYDHFVNTTESRIYDPDEKDNGGGPSIKSSGGSSSGGKF